MNERAREILVEAAMRGIQQAKGTFHTPDNQHCALGALHLSLHGWDAEKAYVCVNNSHATGWSTTPHSKELFVAFDITQDEACKIAVTNDVYEWDFIHIARKFGVEHE